MMKNLTSGSPARLIFFFALPLIAGNMMQPWIKKEKFFC